MIDPARTVAIGIAFSLCTSCAETPPPETPGRPHADGTQTQQAAAEARRLFSEGAGFFKDHNYPEARKRFEAANVILPSPFSTFALAQTSEALNEVKDAYNGYLRVSRMAEAEIPIRNGDYECQAGDPNAILVLQVCARRRAERLEPATARVRLDWEGWRADPRPEWRIYAPKRVLVQIDGIEMTKLDNGDDLSAPLAVNPGRHILKISAPGSQFEPFEEDVEVNLGEQLSYRLKDLVFRPGRRDVRVKFYANDEMSWALHLGNGSVACRFPCPTFIPRDGGDLYVQLHSGWADTMQRQKLETASFGSFQAGSEIAVDVEPGKPQLSDTKKLIWGGASSLVFAAGVTGIALSETGCRHDATHSTCVPGIVALSTGILSGLAEFGYVMWLEAHKRPSLTPELEHGPEIKPASVIFR